MLPITDEEAGLQVTAVPLPVAEVIGVAGLVVGDGAVTFVERSGFPVTGVIVTGTPVVRTVRCPLIDDWIT